MVYDAKWLSKWILKILLLGVFVLSALSIPFLFSGELNSYLAGFAEPLKAEPRKLVLLNSSAYLVLAAMYIVLFAITHLVLRLIFQMKLFSGVLFSLFISSLFFIYGWNNFELKVWSEFIIFQFGSISSVRIILEKLTLTTAFMYLFTILYGLIEFIRFGKLTNFISEVMMFIDQNKSKFNL